VFKMRHLTVIATPIRAPRKIGTSSMGNLDNLLTSHRANPSFIPKNQEVIVKRLFTSLPGLAALAALCLAHTANAAPIGSLSCTTSNSGDIKFNVSFFTFGLTDTANIGSAGTGTGAGKATFQPLEVHAALSTFATLLVPAVQGSVLQNCTLTTAMPDGSTTTFEFKPVAIKALTAVAERTGTTETPAQYTDVQFEYLNVEVKTTSSTDDGGTSPAIGWNRITNGSDTGAPGPN
jgi:hypothetical protein